MEINSEHEQIIIDILDVEDEQDNEFEHQIIHGKRESKHKENEKVPRLDFSQELKLQKDKSTTTSVLDTYGKAGIIAKYIVKIIPYIAPILETILIIIFFRYIYPTMEKTFSAKSRAILLMILFYCLYNLYYHWYKAVITKQSSIRFDHFKKYVEPGVELEKCQHCHTIKYPRTHHCKICGKCVVGYDHHCSWLNCIGIHNIRFFHLFLLNLMIIAAISIFIFLRNLILNHGDPEMYFKTHILLLLFAINMFMTGFFQFVAYTFMISINGTMIDLMAIISDYQETGVWKKPRYYKSFVENWREMYLVRDDLSLFFYFFPYTPTYKYNTHGITLDEEY